MIRAALEARRWPLRLAGLALGLASGLLAQPGLAATDALPPPSLPALATMTLPAAPAAAAVGAAPVAESTALPSLSTGVLPAIEQHASLRAETPLRQRPVAASPLLGTLPASTRVRVLGELANASGRWLSVAAGEDQGWLPAGAVQLDP
jgi:hypothetical protein